MRPHQPRKIRVAAERNVARVRDLIREARRVCDLQMGELGESPMGTLASRIDSLKLALEPFREPDTTDEK